MATAETIRLKNSLSDMGISVRHAVVNQLWPEGDSSNFVARRVKQQSASAEELKTELEKLDANISVQEVPFFDVEVRGVDGLRAVGRVAFGALEVGER
mmetsp:Transcript_34469/g.84484  ORF Transcript_34469/g.84484 Transcript_34469/m.84484 type:complete len:98 (+) Transcript_34469:2043-2336(+)